MNDSVLKRAMMTSSACANNSLGNGLTSQEHDARMRADARKAAPIFDKLVATLNNQKTGIIVEVLSAFIAKLASDVSRDNPRALIDLIGDKAAGKVAMFGPKIITDG